MTAARSADASCAAKTGVKLDAYRCTPWFSPAQGFEACCATTSQPVVATQSDRDEAVMATFRQLSEVLVALSIGHLSAPTRDKLMTNDLSVNAYPVHGGGFVYVGKPRYVEPEEPDLAALFELAEGCGVAWLLFEPSGATVDGLPLYPA